MSDLAGGVLEAGAVLAVNVFGLRGEIPGGVQEDEPGVLDRAHGLQQPRFRKSLVQIIKETKQFTRFHRVERLADVIIARNLLDTEGDRALFRPWAFSMFC
jgi:hypothetical protein